MTSLLSPAVMPSTGLIPRFIALAALATTLISPVSAATVTWTQTGSSGTGTWGNLNPADLTDNMNWTVGANWSGGAAPDASSQIVFGDVTAKLNSNAALNINGRAVGLLDTNFFGDATSSLTLTQTTTGFKNVVAIRHSFIDSSPGNLTFQIGEVNISTNSELRYQGYATSKVDAVRIATFGHGGNAVTNNGTFLVSFGGNNNNKVITGSLQIAAESTFTNTGLFTLNLSAPNNPNQGGTRANALIGNTINSGTISISRSGDVNFSGNAAFDTAQGGIEFVSLHNAGASSNFSMTVDNGTVLIPNVPPALGNRDANLVVGGLLRNEGTFTLNRTPLSADTASRVFSVQAGSLQNDATGLLKINHSNSATPLTATSSLIEFTVLGQATNEGALSLSGKGQTLVTGNVLTRLVTQSGFTNKQGGIITVTGQAVLQNTGDLVNLNTAASRFIQGATQTWDTRGLQVNATAAAGGSQLIWATGIVIDPAVLTAAAFSPANFTIGGLQIDGSYTLSGLGDLLIADSFELSGTLNLGDWTSVTTEGGKGQTLFFANMALGDMISELIASGQITANLASGFQLSVISNATNDAFYIGTVAAIPEPGSMALASLIIGGGLLVAVRRRSGAHPSFATPSLTSHDSQPSSPLSSAQATGLYAR